MSENDSANEPNNEPTVPDNGSNHRGRWSLLAIGFAFLFALVVNLWHHDWDAPFNYHPGEHLIYDTAVEMVRSGEYDPQWYGWPSLIFYSEAAVVHAVHGLTDSPLEVMVGPSVSPGMIADGQRPYLTWGRRLVAFLGAVGIAFLVAGIGAVRRVRTDRATTRWSWVLPLGLGCFAALVPLHLQNAHYLTPDIPAVMCTCIGLYAAFRILEKGATLPLALLAGVAIGAGAGFKYTPCLLAFPVAAATLFAFGPFRRRAGMLAVAAVTAALTFLATTPYLLFNLEVFQEGMDEQVESYIRGGHPGHVVDAGVLSLFKRLGEPSAFGFAIMGLAGAAVLMLASARFRRSLGRPVLVLLSFVIPFVAIFAFVTGDFSRTALPLLPALILLAAATTYGAREVLPGRVFPAVIAIAVTACLLPTAFAGVDRLRHLGLEHTETQAYDWVVANIPQRANILREWYTPQLRPDEYAVFVTETVSSLSTAALGEAGADYAILSSEMFRRFANPEPDDPESMHRYEVYTLAFSMTPVAVICPEAGVSVGPQVWIFPLSDRARAHHTDISEVGHCSDEWPWLQDTSP